MNFKLPKEIIQELDRQIVKLSSKEPEERMEAMARLVTYEQSGKIPFEALTELAGEANPSMAMYGIMALGRKKSAPAAERLAELARQHRTGNRLFLETIIDALGDAGQKLATPVLLDLIGIKFGIWARMRTRLKGRDDKEAPAQAKQRELLLLPIVRALEKLDDPRAAEAISPFLDHGDPLIRWHVIQSLQRCRVTQFNGRLRELAEGDTSDLVREAASMALTTLEPLPEHLNN